MKRKSKSLAVISFAHHGLPLQQGAFEPDGTSVRTIPCQSNAIMSRRPLSVPARQIRILPQTYCDAAAHYQTSLDQQQKVQIKRSNTHACQRLDAQARVIALLGRLRVHAAARANGDVGRLTRMRAALTSERCSNLTWEEIPVHGVLRATGMGLDQAWGRNRSSKWFGSTVKSRYCCCCNQGQHV